MTDDWLCLCSIYVVFQFHNNLEKKGRRTKIMVSEGRVDDGRKQTDWE